MVTMKFLIALAFAAPMLAQNCTWVVTPTSIPISADTNTGTIHVTQTQGSACGNYSASTQTPWLHITSLPAGTPGTDVTFSAEQNLAATPRSGIMTIATQTVTVTQAGASCACRV